MSSIRPFTLNELLYREPIKVEIPFEKFKERANVGGTSNTASAITEQINLSVTPATTPSTESTVTLFFKQHGLKMLLLAGTIVLCYLSYRKYKRRDQKR